MFYPYIIVSWYVMIVSVSPVFYLCNFLGGGQGFDQVVSHVPTQKLGRRRPKTDLLQAALPVCRPPWKSAKLRYAGLVYNLWRVSWSKKTESCILIGWSDTDAWEGRKHVETARVLAQQVDLKVKRNGWSWLLKALRKDKIGLSTLTFEKPLCIARVGIM